MLNVFHYDEQGIRAYDLTEDVLTEVNGLNIILKTLTNLKIYFDQKSLEKLAVEKLTSDVRSEKRAIAVLVFTNYNDKEREQFIEKMIECAHEKVTAVRITRSMEINVCNAQRLWEKYKECCTTPYKKKALE